MNTCLGKFFVSGSFWILWPCDLLDISSTYHNIFLPRAISYQRIFFDPQLSQGLGQKEGSRSAWFEHLDPWIFGRSQTGIKNIEPAKFQHLKFLGLCLASLTVYVSFPQPAHPTSTMLEPQSAWSFHRKPSLASFNKKKQDINLSFPGLFLWILIAFWCHFFLAPVVLGILEPTEKTSFPRGISRPWASVWSNSLNTEPRCRSIWRWSWI